MPEPTWTTLESSYALENPYYKVRKDSVIRPDGIEGTYNVVELDPSVMVIAVTTDQKILLISLYRYTTGRTGWELPCGGANPGEPLLQAAQRELHEETGCVGNTWLDLGSFDSMNGITNGECFIFVAQDLSRSATGRQLEEGISDVQEFSLNQVHELIRRGEVTDGLSISALFKLTLSRILS